MWYMLIKSTLYLCSKDYLVDAWYPNPIGYLGSYKEIVYHLPEFRQDPTPIGYREKFNRTHSSQWLEIKRAFGILKSKWKILKHMPSYPFVKQIKIVIKTRLCTVIYEEGRQWYRFCKSIFGY